MLKKLVALGLIQRADRLFDLLRRAHIESLALVLAFAIEHGQAGGKRNRLRILQRTAIW